VFTWKKANFSSVCGCQLDSSIRALQVLNGQAPGKMKLMVTRHVHPHGCAVLLIRIHRQTEIVTKEIHIAETVFSTGANVKVHMLKSNNTSHICIFF